VKDEQHEELKQVRVYIHSSFEEVKCFLMPHPGFAVSTSQDFHGEIQGRDELGLGLQMFDPHLAIEKPFVEHLRVLVPSILSSRAVQPKRINGQAITCRELLVYMKAYTAMFQGDELPEPKSMITVRF
jgi:atlastin